MCTGRSRNQKCIDPTICEIREKYMHDDDDFFKSGYYCHGSIANVVGTKIPGYRLSFDTDDRHQEKYSGIYLQKWIKGRTSLEDERDALEDGFTRKLAYCCV